MSIVKINEKRLYFNIYNYILKNKKEYVIILLIFFLGLMIGIFNFNNCTDEQVTNINLYLSDIFNNIKSGNEINVDIDECNYSDISTLREALNYRTEKDKVCEFIRQCKYFIF